MYDVGCGLYPSVPFDRPAYELDLYSPELAAGVPMTRAHGAESVGIRASSFDGFVNEDDLYSPELAAG